MDPRRAIARLAAAVMVADARVTTSEIAAVAALVRLGLGSLEAVTRDELARAAEAPLDVVPACAALVAVYPDAGGTILAALADLAVSDGELDPREVALLGRIGDALDVAPAIVAHVVRAAAADAGVPLPTGEPAGSASAVTSGSPTAAAPGVASGSPTAAAPGVASGSPTATAPGVVRGSPTPAAPPAASGSPAAAPVAPEALPSALDAAYALLGVEPGAAPAAVEQAYRAQLERYQPLRVLDLGPEFAVLAVRRLAAATAAFTAIKEVGAA